jgi:hypothetical protein
MPPQQGYRLLDFVDKAFRLGAHGLALPFLSGCRAHDRTRGTLEHFDLTSDSTENRIPLLGMMFRVLNRRGT